MRRIKLKTGDSRYATTGLAHLFGILCTTLVQVLQVPVLGCLWTPPFLAAYLAATALIAVMYFFDVGIAQAAVTRDLLRGRSADRARTFAAACLFSALSYAVLVVPLGLVAMGVLPVWSFGALSPAAVVGLGLVALTNAVLVPVSGAAYRLADRTARGVILANLGRLSFFVLVTVFSLIGDGSAAIAAAALFSSLFHAVVFLAAPGVAAVLRKARSAPGRGLGWAPRRLLASLLPPLSGNVAGMVVEALRVHAPVLLAARFLPAPLVVAFVSCRMLSRVPYQFSLAQKSAISAEVARDPSVRRITRTCVRLLPVFVLVWSGWLVALRLAGGVVDLHALFFFSPEQWSLLTALSLHTLIVAAQNSFGSILQGRNHHRGPFFALAALWIVALGLSLPWLSVDIMPIVIAGIVADALGLTLFLSLLLRKPQLSRQPVPA